MKPWMHKLVPMASHLPNRVLMWLEHHWRLGYDPSDGLGWTFWTDASYHKYVRQTMMEFDEYELQHDPTLPIDYRLGWDGGYVLISMCSKSITRNAPPPSLISNEDEEIRYYVDGKQVSYAEWLGLEHDQAMDHPERHELHSTHFIKDCPRCKDARERP